MPDISKIKLPSGSTYDIKDAVARQMISGGVSFIVAWDGTGTPDPAQIPAGVKVVSGGTTYTGTLAAGDAQPGAFYLVKSSTTTSEGPLDVYDEYVPVGSETKSWEKIGDTQVDLSNVVTNVELNKSTTNVMGTSASLTTTKIKATASGGSTAWNSKDSVTAITGLSNTNVKATASGANTAWNSKDQKAAVTGYSNTTSDSVIGSDATFTTDTFVKSVTAETNKNLVTTTVTGVQASTTTASKASASKASSVSRASQTTADGTDTRKDANATVLPADTSANPSANDYILRRVGVSDETLIIGSVELDTQTTYSVSSLSDVNFSDVTVPIKNASATTVATGSTASTGTGSAVVTGVTIGDSATAVTGWDSKDSVTALTGLGTPSTANVIGASATFTITQPTVALATGATAGTGVISVTTGQSSTDTVIGTDATFTNTQPTVTIATGSTGDVTVATGAWTNRDSKTVLDNNTSITVTKGSNE